MKRASLSATRIQTLFDALPPPTPRPAETHRRDLSPRRAVTASSKASLSSQRVSPEGRHQHRPQHPVFGASVPGAGISTVMPCPIVPGVFGIAQITLVLPPRCEARKGDRDSGRDRQIQRGDGAQRSQPFQQSGIGRMPWGFIAITIACGPAREIVRPGPILSHDGTGLGQRLTDLPEYGSTT